MVTRRALRIGLALAACLFAGACSLGRLAYSNAAFAYSKAPPALAWMVGDYTDLSSDQKDWLRERVDAAFAWHRAQELPQYRQFCERLLAQAADGISVDEARAANKALRGYYDHTLDHVIPDLADLLRRLDGEQVGQLEQRFARDNEKMVRDAGDGSIEERAARRATKYAGHLEEFVGPLTGEQQAIVARHAARYEELTEMRLADRKFRQSETLALVRAHASREEMIAGLHRLLVDTPSWRDPAYRGKLREREENLFGMIAEVSAALSTEQREHLQSRIRGFIRDMRMLSAQRG